MRNMITATTLGLALLAGIGCADKTEGERTLDRAQRVEQAGDTIVRGENLVADGRASIARGEALRDQGNRLEGEKLIADGKSKRSQGEKLIEEGRKMRD